MQGHARADEVASLQLPVLARAYTAGSLTVSAVVEALLARIAGAGEDHVWICRAEDATIRARAAALDAELRGDPAVLLRRPLFGVPFAVKDNIDVAGLPTTAGCPAFAYIPERSAFVVERLVDAGALLIGKTNLDQFATGLVGTRSPYGVPRNPFDARYIPGGSSSGSAVAVAAGLVSFALGTDTAGSGRVPAAFNNVVGLKPTRGIVSASGVVPACRSIDCVSIFAFTAADALHVLDVAAAYDPTDAFSRPAVNSRAAFPERFRFAVPAARDRVFFGNREVEALYGRAIEELAGLGGTPIEIDLAPFREVAALLYSGPWLAERLATVESLARGSPDALHPVTRAIIARGGAFTAVDAFRGLYRLGELRQRTLSVWDSADLLVLPTAGTIYTIAEVTADPFGTNANLGAYTNFVNLLDLAAHAIPCGFQANGLPAGITLLAPAFSDRALGRLADAFQRRLALPLGAGQERMDPGGAVLTKSEDRITLAVVGAHMRGLPLNGELIDQGGSFVETTRTAAAYRLFALDGTPARPGMVRAADGAGAAIEVELWQLDVAGLGAILARTLPPLTIGTVELGDGRRVKGFLCEAAATAGRPEITGHGGWRSYLAARA